MVNRLSVKVSAPRMDGSFFYLIGGCASIVLARRQLGSDVGEYFSSLLDQIEDPFQTLHIASLSKARALSKEKQWQSFIKNASNNGASMAFYELSKHYRKNYRERLTECAAKWWN